MDVSRDENLKEIFDLVISALHVTTVVEVLFREYAIIRSYCLLVILQFPVTKHGSLSRTLIMHANYELIKTELPQINN